ncbi:hypothetical protein ABZS29_02440 [Kribbella sp. NPDC005582]|uniref:hypothetical protein n=1 Tax=Kribbella sp. NPDC005582 TaxID=3156893 RepID=UPI00339EB0FA
MSDEKAVVPDKPSAVVAGGEGRQKDEADGLSVNSVLEEQDAEAEQFAVAFLKKVVRLRGVRVDRSQFLRAELHKQGVASAAIDRAVDENPAAAGIPLALLDDIARSVVEFETRKSTALSFAAGLPGGFAMVGTVPADITQFYVHAFRVMQKLAYLYGWQSFLDDIDEVDDESLGILAAFLGIMMGVGGASVSLSLFAAQVARPAVQKKIAGVALTKTAWYLPMKQILRVVGIHVTKQSFARSVSKVVPVVGGVVSGGLTFVTLRAQSKRLMEHLRELPPPNVDAEVYLAAVQRADELGSMKTKSAGDAMVGAAGAVGSNIAGLFKSKKSDK